MAFHWAIFEDHPSSLSSVAKRANLVYFGDGSGNTVKTKTNQPPTPQMVLISHSQLRKDKREHAKSSGTEGAIRGGAKSRAPAGRHLGMEVGTPACTPSYGALRELETSSLTPHCSATACRACSRWPRAYESGVQWFVCCIVCGVPLCPLVSAVSPGDDTTFH